jgi:hypothetical protein
MREFLFLMHDDFDPHVEPAWEPYLAQLTSEGVLRGGSAIGHGVCVRQSGAVPEPTAHLVGYLKIEARDLDHARQLIAGNPVYLAGGTVEIRELPKTS